MKWTDVKPTVPGWYWYRHGPSSDGWDAYLVLYQPDEYGIPEQHSLTRKGVVITQRGYAIDSGQWSDAAIPEPEGE